MALYERPVSEKTFKWKCPAKSITLYEIVL